MDCYIALGGNYEQTLSKMRAALHALLDVKEIFHLKSSPVYRTTPISPLIQPPYLNAVCRFTTTLTLDALWEIMQEIEKQLGKLPKSKSEPRAIDLDLLFFGDLILYTKKLILPHPKWHERLFVLAPLADVTDTIPLGINMKELLKKFLNPHNERVEVCNTLI